MNIRPFNDNDWCAFGGAEKFLNGDDPLIDADDEVLCFVAGGGGIEVFENTEDDIRNWFLHMSIPNAAVGELILRSLPGTLDELKALGFGEI